MARAPEAPYVNRALAGTLAHMEAPVVLLEGMAGSGKTALARNEPALGRFGYVTLGDERTLAQAQRSPIEWAASLEAPVIIDDAHRLDGLVEAVAKVAVKAPPQADGGGPAFILMGSQAFASAVEMPRFTLFPLTQAELRARKGCIIDDLFDGTLCPNFLSRCTRSDLRTMLRAGSLPARMLRGGGGDGGRGSSGSGGSAKPGLRSLLPEPALQAIGEGDPDRPVGPDQLVARAVLDKVLDEPGLYLNVEAAARACYVDVAAFAGHLGCFADSLAVHCLPKLGKMPREDDPFASVRVYPADTALCVEALRGKGRDIALDHGAFGKAMRAFCINQLVPAAQWAAEPTWCCHWRRFDRKVRSVDLVLARKGRLVGIQMRNSAVVRGGDVGVLRLLEKDKRFERGYILYQGASTVRLSERVWALPVSALWEEWAFCPVV